MNNANQVHDHNTNPEVTTPKSVMTTRKGRGGWRVASGGVWDREKDSECMAPGQTASEKKKTTVEARVWSPFEAVERRQRADLGTNDCRALLSRAYTYHSAPSVLYTCSSQRQNAEASCQSHPPLRSLKHTSATVATQNLIRQGSKVVLGQAGDVACPRVGGAFICFLTRLFEQLGTVTEFGTFGVPG